MIADSSEELLKMADRLGLKHEWIQHPGTFHEHFDVGMKNRERAVKAGAIEINFRDFARMIGERRKAPTMGPAS
jgi:hypothetical protein